MVNNFSENAKKFKAINEMAVKNEIAVFGSDYLFNFPFYDYTQGRVSDYAIYNRSMENLNVANAAEIAGDCLKHLCPKAVLFSFGENEVIDNAFVKNYEKLLLTVRKMYKNTKFFVLQTVPDKKADDKIRAVADKFGAEFVSLYQEAENTNQLFLRLSGLFRNGKISFADAFSI